MTRTTLASWLPIAPPEHRSEFEIERDLDDEFAFHLERRAADLEGRGAPPDAARLEALARFGNLPAIKQQCRRLALKERVMLQRVNFVMMIVVLIAVVLVGLQVMITQRYNTLALQAITADLARMKFEDAASARVAANQSSGGLVQVQGEVPRPGMYNIPSYGRLTLPRLVASTGNPPDQACSVTMLRDGESTTFDLSKNEGADVVLQDGDTITVALLGPQADANRKAKARAQAVGEFIVGMYSHLRRDDPNPTKTISEVLDKAESQLDTKYADDPAVAGIIRELITARRSYLQANAGRASAEASAEASVSALTAMLNSMIASADPAKDQVNIKEVLDHAQQRVATDLQDAPQVAAEIRERIAEAQRKIDQMNAQAGVAADGDPSARIDDDHFPKRSPFMAVRWKDEWTPIVNYDSAWYELVALDGLEVAALLDHCRQKHGDMARRRFSEDLVQVLTELGREPADTIDLRIAHMDTGTVMAVNAAPMTEANREMVLRVNRSVKDDTPRWSGPR